MEVLDNVDGPRAEQVVNSVQGMPERLPHVGEIILYYVRPGMARRGRLAVPFMVTKVHEETAIVEGIAFMDAGDQSDHSNVHFRTEDEPYHTWGFMEGGEAAEPSRLNALGRRFAEMQEQLDALRKFILGDYKMPGQSLMDILVMFEKRVMEAEGGKPPKKRTSRGK